MKNWKDYLKVIWRLWKFLYSPQYRAAVQAVEAVARDKSIRNLGETEGVVSFCPRCGQRPQNDVRHDEAFEIAFGILEPKQRTLRMHFALELALWLRKGA